jgi:hypothetical protein
MGQPREGLVTVAPAWVIKRPCGPKTLSEFVVVGRPRRFGDHGNGPLRGCWGSRVGSETMGLNCRGWEAASVRRPWDHGWSCLVACICHARSWFLPDTWGVLYCPRRYGMRGVNAACICHVRSTPGVWHNCPPALGKRGVILLSGIETQKLSEAVAR